MFYSDGEFFIEEVGMDVLTVGSFLLTCLGLGLLCWHLYQHRREVKLKAMITQARKTGERQGAEAVERDVRRSGKLCH